jgi:hypothetical protein
MKILRIPVVLLFSALLIAGLEVGCNTTQQRAVANTLSATHDVVAAGVDSYYIATAQGLASTNGIEPVGSAYNKFQKVYVAAVIFAQNNTNALAPDSVIQEAGAVANIIDQFYKPASAQIKTKLKIP